MSDPSVPASFDALIPYGWSDRVAALLASVATPARVVRIDRDRCLVVTAAGESLADRTDDVCVGDWVALGSSDHSDIPWHIVAVATRWSVLERADPRSDAQSVDTVQVLAANVDLVACVHPLDRPVSANRIEREVAMAWQAGALPFVVLTKADRHDDPDAAAAHLEHRLLGVDVVVTAALEGAGLEDVRHRLRPDRTMMLFGASGAGKSTLVNALTGTDQLATGGVRRTDARGRHTTTARHLVPVPGGGVLLDTPGIRSIGLLEVAEGVSAVFADVEDLATACRFSNCGHRGEPGCAIAAAVATGELDAARLESWRKLQREAASTRARVDPLAAAARNAELRRRGRAMKQAKQQFKKR